MPRCLLPSCHTSLFLFRPLDTPTHYSVLHRAAPNCSARLKAAQHCSPRLRAVHPCSSTLRTAQPRSKPLSTAHICTPQREPFSAAPNRPTWIELVSRVQSVYACGVLSARGEECIVHVAQHLAPRLVLPSASVLGAQRHVRGLDGRLLPDVGQDLGCRQRNTHRAMRGEGDNAREI